MLEITEYKYYLQVIADIIGKEMQLMPDTGSTDVCANRVFIGEQNAVLPKERGIIVILTEAPGKVISNKNTTQENTDDPLNPFFEETSALIMQKEVTIEIMSRSNEALVRKEEILMALMSTYSESMQEKYEFQIARHSTSFIDTSAAEMPANMYRYTMSIMCTVSFEKSKAIEYYDDFDYNTITN